MKLFLFNAGDTQKSEHSFGLLKGGEGEVFFTLVCDLFILFFIFLSYLAEGLSANYGMQFKKLQKLPVFLPMVMFVYNNYANL